MPDQTTEHGFGITTISDPIRVNPGDPIFEIISGPIRIVDLFSYCIEANDAVASTLGWKSAGPTTIAGESTSLADFPAGGVLYCDFTTLSTAVVKTATTGVYLAGTAAATGGGVVVPSGVISLVNSSGVNGTATFQHYLHWIPLKPGGAEVIQLVDV